MKSKSPLPLGARISQLIGVACVAGVLLYSAFVALDTLGLPSRTDAAMVLDKARYLPGTSYETMIVGGRTFVLPHDTPEAYVLKLRVNGQEAGAVVERGVYDAVNSNSELQVICQRSRITGNLRVVHVAVPTTKGAN